MKFIFFIVVLSLSSVFFMSAQLEEVLFYEDFETGSRPAGWTEQIVQGPAEYWRYRNGGHNPLDPNNDIPPGDIDNGRNPDRAYGGTYNAYFQKESVNNEKTRLITRAIDLEYSVKPELRFWHAQVPWSWSGQINHDSLNVYYRTSSSEEWILLAEFKDPVEQWTQHIIPLPDPGKTYYLAFEGQTGWGYGVVLDDIEIVETGIIEREVKSVTVTQADTDFVLAGSTNNEILRLHFKVTGNTGDLKVNSIKVGSLNTSDDDIAPGGVRLFQTTSASFSPMNPVGTATGFASGEALFSAQDISLPTGESYLWITYDVNEGSAHGNIIDGMITAGSIGAGTSVFPDTDVSPAGSRKIQESIYYDNFDTPSGWVLTGEFEIAAPEGGGGTPGGPNPVIAYSGTNVLGTDITGLGASPYKYEPGLIDTTSHYHATSPAFDLLYYRDVALRFRQWLNIELWDGAYIELSSDGGTTWSQVWRNSNFVLDNNWVQKSYMISMLADRKENVLIRFGLGETDHQAQYSGWNIDNFVLTGEYVTRDMGVTELIGPGGDCGMSASETVTVRVRNFAAEATAGPIPVAYSIDGGITWVEEEITEVIDVGGEIEYAFTTRADFSVPGLYNVVARSSYSGDQEPLNDLTQTSILSLPVYQLPYSEDFEDESAIFWRPSGTTSSWEHGEPSGTIINSSAGGLNAWVTNLTGAFNSGESSWVEAPCFDVSGNAYPVFEMSTWWNTPGVTDYASVLYSTDNRVTWHKLGTQGQGDEYLWNWYNSPDGWSGQTDMWHTSRILLPAEVIGQTNVCFRVDFNAAEGEKTHEGFAFDNIKIYNVPHDAGVSSILYPVSGCAYTSGVQPLVEIENFGLEPIKAGTVMEVGFDIDGTNSLTESFTLEADLLPGNRLEYSFTGSISMSAEGEFDLTSYTLLDGDIDFYNEGITNDTTALTLVLNPIPIVELGHDIYTVLPDTVVIDAWAGIAGYTFEWQDGSTGSSINVTEEGIYKVTVTDGAGCFTVDSVIVVKLIADVGVSDIVSPGSSCSLGDMENLTVLIHNYGTDTININDQFPVYARINGGVEVMETVTVLSELLPDSSMTYTFSQVFDLSAEGVYSISARTQLANDIVTVNDQAVEEIEVYGFPLFDLGGDVEITGWEYQVDAGSGFASYLWHDGSTEQTYTAAQPGENVVSAIVTDHNNCEATDELIVHLRIIDMEIDSVISPVSSCGTSGEAVVSLLVRNAGNVPLTTGVPFTLGYSVNNGEEITEEFYPESDIAAGDTAGFDLSGLFLVEEGNWYDFRVFVNMAGDMDYTNDSMEVDVGIFEQPVVDLGPDAVSQELNYTVDAGEGFASYLWHDGSTGHTYTTSMMGINNISVTVTDENNCQAYDSKQVLILVSDIGVSEIQMPEILCSFTKEPVRGVIRNYGNTNIASTASIKVAYRINGGDPVFEDLVLSSSFGAGTTVYHEFLDSALFEPGQHIIEAWTIYASDLKSENDSIMSAISVGDAPFVDLGNGETDIVTHGPLVLDAGAGYTDYLWQDGTTTQTYNIDTPVDDYFHVRVTDVNGCEANDTVHVSFLLADLALTDINGPSSACELTGTEPISVEIWNNGKHPVKKGEIIRVYFSINSGPPVGIVITLGHDMDSGATINHEFDTQADFSVAGRYEILAWLEYDNDGKQDNNSLTRKVEIYGNPAPDLSGGADTLYSSLPLVISPGNFETYLWQDNSTGESFEVTQFGTYTVEVTDQYGCKGSDTVIIESTLSTYTPEGIVENVMIYPNPVSEKLYVKVINAAVHEALFIELLDARGIRRYRREIKPYEVPEDEIDAGRFPEGIYILRITSEGKSLSRQVLIH